MSVVEELAKIDVSLDKQFTSFLSVALQRGNVFQDPNDITKLMDVADSVKNGKCSQEQTALVKQFCELFLKGGAARELAEAVNLIRLYQQFQYFDDIAAFKSKSAST
jgi:hypothetical protein